MGDRDEGLIEGDDEGAAPAEDAPGEASRGEGPAPDVPPDPFAGPEEPAPFVAIWLGGTLLLGVLLAAAWGLVATLPWWGAMPALLVLTVILGRAALVRLGGPIMLVWALALIGGANALLTLPQHLAIAGGELLSGATAAELPARPQATRFTFRPGVTVRADLAASVERSSGRAEERRTTSYHAAPLVDPGWDPRSPVPAWVVSDAGTRTWQHPWGAVSSQGDLSERSYREAIRKAERAGGLTSVDGAPLIRWVREPDAEARMLWNKLVAGTIACMAVWVLGLPAWLWIRRRYEPALAG